jgi:hypothetical protein
LQLKSTTIPSCTSKKENVPLIKTFYCTYTYAGRPLPNAVPAHNSPLESFNAEGVVRLLLFTTVYVACMFYVFCYPLVSAALGSTAQASAPSHWISLCCCP